ncbi:MAG: site-specific DNA-methyltransferase [Anaerolineae bacterium]|nr:site-specific DNA-methyltransferase [Anaerolineae bacterium]
MPVKYIPYFPETIQGQALLDSFTRTHRALKYRDNDKVITRVLRGMPLHEVETVERIGENPAGNLVIRGECLTACAYLKAQGVRVDLVYIDPPFASGANYAKRIYLRRNPKVAEALAKAEEELPDDELQAFEEKMYGDIWNKEAYLNWMYENLLAIKSVMSETGSIYVHLDYHIGHYVKVLMDEIFGEDNFQNEVVWKRTTSRAGSKFYNHIHDVIFFYALSEDTAWNQLYTEYSDEYIAQMFKFSDPDGRKWRESPLTAPGKRSGTAGAPWKGIDPGKIGKGRHWAVPGFIREQLSQAAQEDTQMALDELERLGRIVWARQGQGMPNFKQYVDDLEGVELQSMWLDVNGAESEYDTQKPEALLNRIVEASSNEGMLVADFFGGSGVAAKVAHDLGRRFVHVDVGLNSVQTARDRLLAAGASFDVLEVRDGVALFRNPAQTMDKLRELIPGLGAEESLDKLWAGAIHDSKDGLVPVYLPNLLDHIEKVLDIPLMNRILQEMLPDLPEGVQRAVVYYVDVDDMGEMLKFIAEVNPTTIKVELHDLKQVLHEVVVNDIVEYVMSENDGVYTIEITRFVSDRLIQRIDAYNQKRAVSSRRKGQMKLEDAATEDAEEAKPVQTIRPLRISADGLELIELVSLDCQNAEGIWCSDEELKIDKRSYVILNGVKTKTFWDGRITAEKRPLRLKVRNIAGDETIIAL